MLNSLVISNINMKLIFLNIKPISRIFGAFDRLVWRYGRAFEATF